jgi:flagellar biosynthesis component FlhA
MDVEFLRNTHRHLFYISIKKEIKHNNRDIEIIMFKRKIEKYLHDKYHHNFKSMSCEDICEDLIKEFSLSYCQVLEDNENGAEIWAE